MTIDVHMCSLSHCWGWRWVSGARCWPRGNLEASQLVFRLVQQHQCNQCASADLCSGVMSTKSILGSLLFCAEDSFSARWRRVWATTWEESNSWHILLVFLFWKLPQTDHQRTLLRRVPYIRSASFCWVYDWIQALPVLNQTQGIHCKAGCDPGWIWREIWGRGRHTLRLVKIVKRFEMYSWPSGRRSCYVLFGNETKQEWEYILASIINMSFEIIYCSSSTHSFSLSLSLLSVFGSSTFPVEMEVAGHDLHCLYAVRPFLKLLLGQSAWQMQACWITKQRAIALAHQQFPLYLNATHVLLIVLQTSKKLRLGFSST